MRSIGRRVPGALALGLGLGVALLVGACSGDAPPYIGISQTAAYSTALHEAPGATEAVSGKLLHIRDVLPGQTRVPADKWVWAIVVRGSFPSSCGPAPTDGGLAASCPAPATTETVILDYGTGAFIAATASGQ